MIRISKKGDYGLIFLSFLARKENTDFVSLRDVSKDTNIPYKFLSQIALDLKKAKLITSREGSSGGYKLAKDKKSISLKDILTVLEGPIAPVSCLRNKNCKCKSSCRHFGAMYNLAQTVETALANQTLADITIK